MRGKVAVSTDISAIARITPAYSGKSDQLVASEICEKGSPLRMRGKDSKFSTCFLSLRITPAYAGKRLKRSRKIVLFKSTVNHFHLVCNKPDTANDNLQWLGAAAWF